MRVLYFAITCFPKWASKIKNFCYLAHSNVIPSLPLDGQTWQVALWGFLRASAPLGADAPPPPFETRLRRDIRVPMTIHIVFLGPDKHGKQFFLAINKEKPELYLWIPWDLLKTYYRKNVRLGLYFMANECQPWTLIRNHQKGSPKITRIIRIIKNPF